MRSPPRTQYRLRTVIPTLPRSAPGVLRTLALTAAGLVAVLRASAWTVPPVEPEFFRTPTPREAHVLELRRGVLADTRLGRGWLASGRRALSAPLPLEYSHLEEGRFVPEEPTALGFRIPVARGQRLEVEVEGPLWDQGRLFLDLLRLPPAGAPGDRPVSLLSAAGRDEPVSWEPEADREILVRLQPELFAGGTYRIRLRRVAALEFPVAGRDQRAVLSVFGAPREGGRRSHHGVDIFAPRGTPVVAAAAGVVRRANETPIGGRVVWLRDPERGQSLYYAHLDRQGVRAGERVEAGDTIGWVGNTGNARSTPPHLHFGIYRRRRGPVDPLPYIRVLPSEAPGIRADPAVAGGWVTPRTGEVQVRTAPSLSAPVLATVNGNREMRVVGVTGAWYRIHLEDGTPGFVAEEVAETGAVVAQQ